MNVTYSECMFLALLIRHEIAHAPYYTVICDMSGSTIFFFLLHFLINGHDFTKETLLNTKKCVF
jgi:hypothetical protein